MLLRQVLRPTVGADDVIRRDDLVLADRLALPRSRQDALGAGVQHAAGAGGQGFLEDIDRPEVVDLAEQPSRPGPQLRIGGEVVDLGTAGDGTTNTFAI